MAWPFLEPVDPNDAPDYYGVIKEPMGKSISGHCTRGLQKFSSLLYFCWKRIGWKE